MDKHLISVTEASKRVGVSAYYIKQLIKEGKLLAGPVGKRTFVISGSIDAYLEECERIASEAPVVPPTATYIYGLHTGDDDYRYIGRTNDPRARLWVHRSTARLHTTTTRKDEWIREVGPEKVEFTVLDVLEDATEAEAGQVELAYITTYLEKGFDLLNHLDKTG